MSEVKENVIVTKSYAFAIEIIKLYRELVEQKEYLLSNQMLRSGTSVGANIHECIAGESKKDFIHKLSIALKETRETSFWLKLLKDSDYISSERFDPLMNSCIELTKILNSIILTTKQRYFPNT